MSQLLGKNYVPPFSGVRLIECWDHIALVPVASFREFFGYGKVKASEVVIELADGKTEPFWDNCAPDEEVWAVVQWGRYEDGHREQGTISYLRPPATEDDARKAMERLKSFYRTSRDELEGLTKLFKATKEDYDYIDSRFPNYQSPPSDPKALDEYNVYQARLKVLAGLHPRTAKFVKLADETQDPVAREKIWRKAVQAYFAELAHYWTEDEVLAWQRNNPIGTEWMCEFGRVIAEPKRKIDSVNHELALNWLRQKYNLLTENELSDAVLDATGRRVKADTLKKRRGRLGLMTKRLPGPKPKSEQ